MEPKVGPNLILPFLFVNVLSHETDVLLALARGRQSAVEVNAVFTKVNLVRESLACLLLPD